MNRFIDDVSVLAVEDCLIGKVAELFRSDKVLDMSSDDISRLAGETAESSVERKRLVDKRKMLDDGLRGLKGLQKQKQFTRLLTGVRCHQEMWKNSWKRLQPIQRVHQSSASLDRRPLRCILRTEYTYPIMETFNSLVLKSTKYQDL